MSTTTESAGTSPPPGSADDYLLRFAAAPGRREALAARLEWIARIEQAVVRMRDPGATRLKLDWWREEIARIDAGRPAQHPLGVALAPALAPGHAEAMLRLIDEAERRVLGLRPEDLDDFTARMRALAAPRLRLALDTPGDVPEARIEALAGWMGAVETLRRLPLDLRRPHCFLPRRDLPDTDTLARTRPRLGARAGALLDALRPDVDPATLPAPLRALHAQHRLFERRLHRADFPTDRRCEVTPIALLWHTWRAVRRHAAPIG